MTDSTNMTEHEDEDPDKTIPYSCDSHDSADMTDPDQTIPYNINDSDENINEYADHNMTIPYSTENKKDIFRLGTLNVNGMKTNTETKLKQLAEDMEKYKIDILAIQETHIQDRTTTTIKTTQGKTYIAYNGQWQEDKAKTKYTGTGFIVTSDIQVTFKEHTDRLTYIRFYTKTGPAYAISAYAPTLPKSEQNEQIRTDFYDSLDKLIQTIPKRADTYILGDFNAKTGDAHKTHPNIVGPYGKGKTNSNGNSLIDFVDRQQMTLVNTYFKHKLAHIATWTKNELPSRRNNPVRNQIDYCITRRKNMRHITDSRAYSGISTETDHRLVMTKIKLKIKRSKHKNKANIKPDIDLLQETEKRQLYAKHVKEGLLKKHETTDHNKAQNLWTHIVETCTNAMNKIKTAKQKQEENTNKHIHQLSQMQKRLWNNILSTNNKELKKKLRTERNNILRQIRKANRDQEEKKLEQQIKDIEQTTNNPNKMFKAIKAMTKQKRTPLTIQTEHGLTADEKLATDEITKYFKTMFQTDTQDKIPEPEKQPMTKPFTTKEITDAIKTLKNNKSAGNDNIYAEQLKYGPKELHTEITNLLNEIAATGEYPSEIKHGLLIPLQKPGKPKGPPENLRPIILLSMIRKILAICLIRRTSNRLNDNIPVTQAAYRPGRNTTEHVLAMKLLCEKAITSADYDIYILLLDMSKAFDTVNRHMLYNILRQILDKDELNMINILLNDVQLQVQNGKTKGETFITNIGIPQGDCLSAVFFTLYLADTLKNTNIEQRNEENQTQAAESKHLDDHNYYKGAAKKTITQKHKMTDKQEVQINQQYADDIGYASNTKDYIEDKKQEIPQILRQRNLQVNLTKTEQYTVKHGNDQWKTCKYLGTILDTENDITRRKTLANAAFSKYKNILTSRKLPLSIRLRLFNVYVQPMFLYNSETWSLTNSLNNKLDAFQRTLLRRLMNIYWPYKITNNELYNRTKQVPWSQQIKRNRLRLTGHILRLPEQAPVKKALAEAIKPTQGRRGRKKTTWLDQVNKDLLGIGLGRIDSQVTLTTARDRQAWRDKVRADEG